MTVPGTATFKVAQVCIIQIEHLKRTTFETNTHRMASIKTDDGFSQPEYLKSETRLVLTSMPY